MKFRMILLAAIVICLVLAGCRKINENQKTPDMETAAAATEITEATASVEIKEAQETVSLQETETATVPVSEKEMVNETFSVEAEYDLNDLILGENQLPFG